MTSGLMLTHDGVRRRWIHLKIFDAATQAHGLATTVDWSRALVSGLHVLGGGVGRLVPEVLTLTVSNLLSAELVTADGSIVQTSESLNSELFWRCAEAAATSSRHKILS